MAIAPRSAQRSARPRATLDALLRFAQDLATATTADAVAALAACAIAEMLRADFVRIALHTTPSDPFVVRASCGFPDDYACGADDDAHLAQTVARAQPNVVADYRRTTEFALPPRLLALGIRSGVSAPLLADNRVVGLALAYARRARRFNARSAHLFALIAQHTGDALEKIRLRDASQRTADELRERAEAIEREQRALNEALRDSAAALNSTLDFDEVLERILSAIGRVVPHDAVNIMLIADGVARIARCQGYAERGVEQAVLALRLRVDEVANLRDMAVTGAPMSIADTHTYPGWLDFPETRWMRSFASAPIRSKDRVLGFLNLDSATPNFYTPAHADRLAAFADQAAIAIENARLFRAEQRRHEMAAALLDIARVVNSSLDFYWVLRRIAGRTAQACQAARCTIFLLEDDALRLRPVMSRFADGHQEREQWERLQAVKDERLDAIPLCALALRERRPMLLHDPRRTDLVPAKWTQPFNVQKLLVIPLFSQEQPLGLLVLDHTDARNEFNAEQIELAQTIGGQVTSAITNAQLYAAAQQRAGELATLARIGEALNRAQTADETLQLILDEATRLVQPAVGSIILVRPNTDRLYMAAQHGLTATAPAVFERLRMTTATGIFTASIQRGESVEIQDTATDPRVLMRGLAGMPKQFVHVPLRGANGALGVIVLHGLPKNDEARQLLRALADLAAAAIEKTRLLDESRRRAAQLDLLRQAAEELATHLEEEPLFNYVPPMLEINFNVQSAIFLRDEATDELLWVAGSRAPGALLRERDLRLRVGEGITGWVAAHGEPMIVSDTRSDPRVLDDPAMPSYSALAVPLRSANQVVGVLFTYRDQPYAFTDEDLNVIETLADQISIALSNARLYAEVRQLAITDGLTGLANHRHFLQIANREFERARQYARPLAAIMLDIDHFKILNDTYGHAVGNEVLRELADRCKGDLRSKNLRHLRNGEGHIEPQLRDIDIMGRYGGEEFAIVLPESDLKGACLVAERLRCLMEENLVPTQRGLLTVTISLGVASMAHDTDDFATMLDRADAAMYAARRGGRRNCVGW
ncbi:MAG: GAF domain-containing protein [Chloroflexota bacterium]